MRSDWPLIEASLATQYGIRIRNDKLMPFSEFITLVSGLMPETPLGRIIGIRAEKDRKVIKTFSPEQRKIHNDWKRKSAEIQMENPEQLDKQMDDLAKMISTMFGKKGGEKLP